jgi:hypothetical protein
MMLIPTRIAASAIHGHGLVATQAVSRGTPIWRFVPGFDQEFTPEAWAALPEPARTHVRHFCFVRQGDLHLILSGDHACFINHAQPPNTGLPGIQAGCAATVALRDIAAGEELTCDYWAYDADTSWKLGQVPGDAPIGAHAS